MIKVSTIALFLISITFWIPPGMIGCGSPVNKEENVKVVFVQWKRATGGITTRPLKETELTQSEIESLSSEHVSGSLNVVGYQIHGTAKSSSFRRILIIMDHQVDKTVDLRQPISSDAIYLQVGNGWKLLPAATVTTDRIIRLGVNGDDEHQTMYWFQLPDGAMQGKTAFIW